MGKKKWPDYEEIDKLRENLKKARAKAWAEWEKKPQRERDRLAKKQAEDTRKRQEEFTERDRRLIDMATWAASTTYSSKFIRAMVAETAEDHDRSIEHHEGLRERPFTEEAAKRQVVQLREIYKTPNGYYLWDVPKDINRHVPSNWINLEDWWDILLGEWREPNRLSEVEESLADKYRDPETGEVNEHDPDYQRELRRGYQYGIDPEAEKRLLGDDHDFWRGDTEGDIRRLEKLQLENPEALEGELAEVKRRHHKKVLTYMEVWRLHHDEDYTIKEIGFKLGISKDTVKKQFYAAFKELTGYDYTKARYDQYKRDQQTGKGVAAKQNPCSLCSEGPKNNKKNMCQKVNCTALKNFLPKNSPSMQFYNFADSMEAEAKLYSTGRVSPYKSADRQKIKFVPEPPEITGRRYKPKPKKKKEHSIKALDDLFKPGGKK